MNPAMIETGRLILRPQQDDDYEWLSDNLNTDAVMRHLGGVRDADALAAGFARNAEAFAKTGTGFWTIVLRDSGERVGKCGLGTIEADPAPPQLHGEPQIGWSLAEPFWGRGIAAEAAGAVLSHGFDHLGHATIWSQTSASNEASTRLMARLGFTRAASLDYLDPAYPPADNPTAVYRLDRRKERLAA